MQQYLYSVRFTNGRIGRRALIVAPDLAFAGMKGIGVARGIMEEMPFGRFDWSDWKVIIDACGEGRFVAPFPT